MEFKVIDSETNEIVMAGKPILSSEINNINKKLYKVEFITENGQTFIRHTDYFDLDNENKVLRIEGMVIKGCEVKSNNNYIK